MARTSLYLNRARSCIEPTVTGFQWKVTIKINNIATNGQYVLVGTAIMDAYGREPPDSDGDGVHDYMDCYPNDPSQSFCGGGGGGDDGGGCDPECIMY